MQSIALHSCGYVSGRSAPLPIDCVVIKTGASCRSAVLEGVLGFNSLRKNAKQFQTPMPPLNQQNNPSYFSSTASSVQPRSQSNTELSFSLICFFAFAWRAFNTLSKTTSNCCLFIMTPCVTSIRRQFLTSTALSHCLRFLQSSAENAVVWSSQLLNFLFEDSPKADALHQPPKGVFNTIMLITSII